VRNLHAVQSRSAVTGHKAGSAGKAAALLGGLATDLGYLSLKGSGGGCVCVQVMHKLDVRPTALSACVTCKKAGS
jgi:hypothetical protein